MCDRTLLTCPCCGYKAAFQERDICDICEWIYFGKWYLGINDPHDENFITIREGQQIIAETGRSLVMQTPIDAFAEEFEHDPNWKPFAPPGSLLDWILLKSHGMRNEALMANNFACIGIPVSDADSFQRFMEFTAYAGQTKETRFGYYIHWSPGEGVEAWTQASLKRELSGCNPHFAGKSRVRVRAEKFIAGNHSPLDGSLQGTMLEESGEDICPVIFDLPAIALDAPSVSPPKVISLQVAAFARELHCFADRAAMDAATDTYGKLASQAFIPTGMFALQEQGTEPQAEAIFSGRVEHYELKTNPLTQTQFHYFLVESLGGSFDVIAEQQTVQGEPTIGGLIAGSFYLSARIAG